VGGALAAIRDGDVIRIDLDGREIELLISQREMKSRLKHAKGPDTDAPGYLARYRILVSSASEGAVLRVR
jgi:dihydroxy-acid dehydratase